MTKRDIFIKQVLQCVILMALFIPHASAQNVREPAKTEGMNAKPAPDKLKGVEAALEKSDFEQKRLAFEINNLSAEAQKMRQSLVNTAYLLREAEENLRASEVKLLDVQGRESVLRNSLVARERVLAEILAAMQRIGHKPPPAVLVAPEDALKSIRAAILLGAVLPDIRDEALLLVADLKTLVELRTQAQMITQALSTERDHVAQERLRLSALIEARQRQMSQSRQGLEAERAKAEALSREAKSLRDLIARSETDIVGTEQVSALARIAPAPLSAGIQTAAPLADGALLQAQRPFAALKGLSPQPVSGRILRAFGAADGFGGTERGITIESTMNALVVAPADARVHFAGPYRGYGFLVILNAGNGYHLVLAGMERLSVEIGQFVLMGEPLGFLGAAPAILPAHARVNRGEDQTNTSANISAPQSANNANTNGGAVNSLNSPLGTSQPALYVEYRKDGVPIDPAPWWPRSIADKARG